MVQCHGEVRGGHLLRHHLLQTARTAGAMKGELILGRIVQRPEKGDALNMIPVKVRNEDVGGKGAVSELTLELIAEDAKPGSAVKDVDAVVEADLNTGGVTSVAHVFGLWRRRGSPYAPELDPHSCPRRLILNLRMPANCRQLGWWVHKVTDVHPEPGG